MAEHNEIGQKGEELAADYLKSKGLIILKRNYRFKHLELDIIAQDQNEIVFVEVKTRQSLYLASPDKTVSKTKQKGLIKAANQYLIENEIDLEARFDIVSIIYNTNKHSIDWLKDAFYPSL